LEAFWGRLSAIFTLIATIVGTRSCRPLYDGYRGESVISDGNWPFNRQFT
jgi:hypothetical protein